MPAVLLEKKETLATITLNRPQTLNSFDEAMVDEALDILEAVEKDQDVRVVVLTGSGKAFCAGGDLAYIREHLTDAASVHRFMTKVGALSKKLRHLRQPTLAMVNGAAAGAGANLALACDIIICTPSCRFGQSFAKVGLIPDAGGFYYLPRAVGLAKAKELMFTGALINAETALSLGLVNRVVEYDRLRQETYQLAAEIASGPPLALAMTKRGLNLSLDSSFDDMMALEIAGQSVALLTEDSREGLAAFVERRSPRFIGA